MIHTKIKEIENMRKNCGLLNIEIRNNRINLENPPPSGSCGLYWFYTNYSVTELIQSTPSSKAGKVNIPILAENRHQLNNVIKQQENNYWIVYNGIGGSSNDTNKYSLKDRILQEIRDNQKTGSLKIIGSSLKDLSRWKYSYVELTRDEYISLKKFLETGWRLEYGWPILSNT